MTEPKGGQHAFSLDLQRLMALVGLTLGPPRERPPDLMLDLTSTDWHRLLALAEGHRVLPLVHAGLKTAPEISVPADVLARLVRQANGLWCRSLILSQELARLSRLLSDHGIPMAAMKGPGLSAQVYGSSVARAMRDLDILIHPEDFQPVQAILEVGGFVCEESLTHLTRPFQDLYLRHATHLSFQHVELGYLLEVHLRPMQIPSLLSIPTETLLAAARPVQLGGGDVPVLAPPHHFLYVAAHGAKHGWWRLLWLADFAAFQRTLQERLVPGKGGSLWEAAENQGLRRVLDAAASLCHLSFGTSPPARTTVLSERSVRAIVAHGCRCLERGRAPLSYTEKWDELFQLLRLRSEAMYWRDVARLYWDLTPTDLASLSDLASLPAVRSLPASILIRLAPALRPALWAIRRLRPRVRLGKSPVKAHK